MVVLLNGKDTLTHFEPCKAASKALLVFVSVFAQQLSEQGHIAIVLCWAFSGITALVDLCEDQAKHVYENT